ncbi:MAG TPA: S8 family serine peptidase [Pseudonocardiaceae bacterium]|nr:S8 family serine peptidase [Pseudonocardiaceae bacterium]
MPLLRRARAAAIGTALLATGALAIPQLAHADAVRDVSAGCVQGGPVLRYLVVFPDGTTSADAASRIAAACGGTTIYYAQIAVAVATSADPDFGQRIGPDRAYSAEAVAYANDRRVDAGPKTDEVPADRDGLTTGSSADSTRDLAGQQWDMAMVKANRAHRIDEGSHRVLVGVLDSGIDPDHPNLTGELDRSASAGCVTGAPDTSESAWVPTTSSHGTHVAGTIAAADDGSGTAGVAPGVRVASVKVVDDDGYIYPEAAVCGIMWAAREGMAIANNSYFVDPWVFTCADAPGQHVIYQALDRAVTYATRHGVLSIAAAGNAGVDLTDPGQDSRSPDNVDSDDQVQRQLGPDCAQLPAGIPGVVTVSAVGADGVKASYSSYGLGAIDVTAPGGDPLQRGQCVLSTVPGGYARSCGTSMAAPHAAGVAALLASTHPDATPAQLRSMLDDEADPIACPGDYDLNGTGAQDAYCTGDSTYNSFYGHGMVDALAAVAPAATATTANQAQQSHPAEPAQRATTTPHATKPAAPPGATYMPSQSAGADPATPTSTPAPTPVVPTVPAAPVTPAGGPVGGFALLGNW